MFSPAILRLLTALPVLAIITLLAAGCAAPRTANQPADQQDPSSWGEDFVSFDQAIEAHLRAGLLHTNLLTLEPTYLLPRDTEAATQSIQALNDRARPLFSRTTDHETRAWLATRVAAPQLHFACRIADLDLPADLDPELQSTLQELLSTDGADYLKFSHAVLSAILDEASEDDRRGVHSRQAAELLHTLEAHPDDPPALCDALRAVWHRAPDVDPVLSACDDGDAFACLHASRLQGDMALRARSCELDPHICSTAAHPSLVAGDLITAASLLSSSCRRRNALSCSELLGLDFAAIAPQLRGLCDDGMPLACAHLAHHASIAADYSPRADICNDPYRPAQPPTSAEGCDEEQPLTCWLHAAHLLRQKNPAFTDTDLPVSDLPTPGLPSRSERERTVLGTLAEAGSSNLESLLPGPPPLPQTWAQELCAITTLHKACLDFPSYCAPFFAAD